MDARSHEGIEEIAERTSRRGIFGWGISPGIERARASRECKPIEKPAASTPAARPDDTPAAPPPEMLATSYSEALGPIRDRIGAVQKIRYVDFDNLAGFAPGLSGKVFGASRVKRLGIEKFFDAIRAAGLRIRFEEDPEQTEKMLKRIADNYNPRQANQARPGNHSHLCSMIDEALGYLANRKGGLARLNKAIKQARSNHARRTIAIGVNWAQQRRISKAGTSAIIDHRNLRL